MAAVHGGAFWRLVGLPKARRRPTRTPEITKAALRRLPAPFLAPVELAGGSDCAQGASATRETVCLRGL